ncbi:MAG: hypothetical protein V2I33_22585 [Kangiellaceae bacterium]|jgi:hypothetical protein|nr:hypothetical protein [Kangiellaceae bacterium]
MIEAKPVDPERPQTEQILMTNKYRTLDELKFEEWEWVKLRVAQLTDHENSLVSTLFRDDFSIHHSIYKRRKIDFHDQTKADQSTMTAF